MRKNYTRTFKSLHYLATIAIFFCLFPLSGFSQDKTIVDTTGRDTMSLDKLTQLKSSGVSSELETVINSGTKVASIKSVSLRKSPGIVTIITEEEIKKSGARDEIDVLRLIPGIDFGVDVEGVVSIGMRGDWAHEGKVLLLLDGQEMNEILYSTIQLGNHFDVSQIKRIEVIRGPGSAIYGGFAEYMVISIITKSGKDINGISASGSYGEMQNALGYRDISLSVGDKIKDLEFSLAAFTGQANRSDRTYTDVNGSSYNMAGNSALNPTNINLGISYKGLSFRGIYDNYQMTTQDDYGLVQSKAYPVNFLSELFELKYIAKLSRKITLTPLVSFKQEKPWNSTGPYALQDSSANLLYDKTAQRYRGSLTMSYDITNKINVIAGGEMYYDYAKDGIDTTPFINGKRTISYINRALYVQSLFKFRIVNIILGARYDNNSGYAPAFVPRIGLIKRINNLTLKLLYNQSFRSPGIEDIDLSASGTIKPEMTQVLEFEGGYEITPDMYVTLNIFDITTKNPIVYVVDTGGNEVYKNLNQQGSRGAELDYRIKSSWGYVDFNYSFYTVAGKTTVPSFQVPIDNNMMLGFAANKFNLYGYYNLTKDISIAPTISWIGRRYGYALDGGGVYLKTYSPTILANLFISYNNCLTHGLRIGIGCYNIFNSDYAFIQPYMTNVLHLALPGQSREFALRLSYDLKFKKK